MVAMAMACQPDIIVFDEPTTALDVTTQIEVLAVIKKITDQFNTAAIYITYDLAVVAQIADRIMVLRHGKMIEENDARQMLDDPREEYTQQLLAVRTYRKEGVRPVSGQQLLLNVEHVTASYSGQELVLQDINLKIRQQRTVALVGESGSGKSTLARVITGLLPPIEARIVFNGTELQPALKSRDRENLRNANDLPDA
jgi:peptide/nickel transport system ATP-binding protein